MLPKIKEWLWRYLPAEVFALIGVFIGGTLANLLFHNSVATALFGTLGENVGFYGKILYKDIQVRKKKDEKITFLGMLKVLRDTIMEFGIAEYLDLIIRPTLMWFFPRVVGNVTLGVLIGKFAADITFYTPAIFFYELRKKVFKD
jgi:hypothetical protein